MLAGGLIQLDIGRGSPSDVTEKYIKFYERTLKIVMGEEVTLPKHPIIESLQLSTKQIVETNSIIYTKMMEYVSDWINDVDVVLIDMNESLDSIIPPKAEAHIATVLWHLYKNHKHKKYILLRKNKLIKGDLTFSAVKEIINNNDLFIISDDGVIESAKPEKTFSQKEYKLARVAIKENVFDLLNARMIRRRGHFHHSKQLQTFFFDGQLCHTQIKKLIIKSIQEKNTTQQISSIFYHSIVSKWMIDPVVAVANELNLPIYNAQLLIEKQLTPEKNEHLENVLIIVPRVETGSTIEKLVMELLALRNDCIVNVIAIISTQVTDDDIKELEIDGTTHQVEYFYLDKQKITRKINGDICSLCVANPKILETNYENESQVTLSTLSFHLMAKEAGWIPETDEDVPETRKKIKLVPNYVRMIDQNGAFLAFKLLELLRHHDGEKFPVVPFLIVHPDQRAANRIATHLKLLHDSITLIQIPTEEINNHRKNPDSGIKNKDALWYKRLLTSGGPSQPVVLMEEFVRTWGTKNVLAALVDSMNKNISCHIALANFSLDAENDNNVITHSLYRIPLGISNS